MKPIHLPSVLLGAVTLAGLAYISPLAQEAEEKTPKADPMLEALKALAVAQERQAAAWEVLAAKGWPAPQNLTLSGSFPSYLSVSLSGGLSLDGSLGVKNSGLGPLQVFTGR